MHQTYRKENKKQGLKSLSTDISFLKYFKITWVSFLSFVFKRETLTFNKIGVNMYLQLNMAAKLCPNVFPWANDQTCSVCFLFPCIARGQCLVSFSRKCFSKANDQNCSFLFPYIALAKFKVFCCCLKCLFKKVSFKSKFSKRVFINVYFLKANDQTCSLSFLFPCIAGGQFCAVRHFVCYWTAGHIALIPLYAP